MWACPLKDDVHMVSRNRARLSGALAGATLVLAACGSTPAPTSGPVANASAPQATGPASMAPTAAPLTATPVTPVATLAPTVDGVANGRIAYAVRAPDGSSNIFSVLPDGTQPLQLTQGAANHLCAAYAADGSQLTYCSDDGGAFEIWTMQADGTQQLQVTKLGGRALWPDFSPNGKKIVFAGVEGADPQNEIYVVDATTGKNLVALTSCKGLAEGCANDYPAWSPDGRHIVYVHTDDYDAAADAPVNEQVWLMDADGANAHALTVGGGPKDQLPTWSPDGKHIAYASGEPVSEGIWVMGADGSGQVQISGCVRSDPAPCAAGSDFGPVWSPDGTRIAFLRAFQAVGTNDRSIWLMNADGTGQERLGEGPSLQTVPAWQMLRM